MKKNIFKRGFTLIELLVVIAIIGILASVVLASLNSARDKGADAAASSSLNNARAQAELYYSNQTPNTYTGVCAAAVAASGIAGNLTGASNAIPGETADCFEDAGGTSWAAGIVLTDGTAYYCVDSTGFGGALAADPTLAAGNTTCN